MIEVHPGLADCAGVIDIGKSLRYSAPRPLIRAHLIIATRARFRASVSFASPPSQVLCGQNFFIIARRPCRYYHSSSSHYYYY